MSVELFRALALASALALAGCSVSSPTPSPAPAPAATPGALMTWPDLLERPRPEPSATITYGDQQMQRVDLWLPAGKGPHPTVLMVHGGCWQTEIADRRIMNWIADDLRKRGIAVWNIDYRGVDREGGGYPGTFADAAAAADALRVHAPRYNLDIEPLVATGHSAGGHLALWLAARPANSIRAATIMITVSAAGEPEVLERTTTRPLEAALRSLDGVTQINSRIRSGESTTFISFATAEAAEAALQRLKADSERLNLGGATLLGPNPVIPRGSPLLAADPLKIDAVVSLGGLPDLELAATPPGSGCGTEIVEKLVGPPTLSSRNVYADTSVPRLAPLGIKQVLVNGRQDRIIPNHYATDYETKMQVAGDEVKVRFIDDTGHVELIAPETKAWAAAVEEIEKALRR